jgi:hypothetical protein
MTQSPKLPLGGYTSRGARAVQVFFWPFFQLNASVPTWGKDDFGGLCATTDRQRIGSPHARVRVGEFRESCSSGPWAASVPQAKTLTCPCAATRVFSLPSLYRAQLRRSRIRPAHARARAASHRLVSRKASWRRKLPSAHVRHETFGVPSPTTKQRLD